MNSLTLSSVQRLSSAFFFITFERCLCVLRLAIAAALSGMADESGRRSKRKQNFADIRHKAKRQCVLGNQQIKRKRSDVDGRHDGKRQRTSSTGDDDDHPSDRVKMVTRQLERRSIGVNEASVVIGCLMKEILS